MALQTKSQRIRDPIHNLIEFRGRDQFEHTMWQVVQTEPFQRLRRIRQLGFSELVFPGATHSRFAHSLGVFHLARMLMAIIKRDKGDTHQAKVALAAALVHDVGHGMFSHAFEDVGKKLNLPMAIHENVSELLIRDSEISIELKKELGAGFPDEVADVIKNKKPGNLFDSVVSSQFDADRLDYMQRDRMMTGVQGSGVDATWIMANLEVGTVSAAADEEAAGEIETLVLGPKAFHAAEHYVLSLFQLYPNVYLHKTTRGAEKLFSSLIVRLHSLISEGQGKSTGLSDNHPIYAFLLDPNKISNAVALDDSVFWGALSLMKDASDMQVSLLSTRLRERKLLKCVDVRLRIEGGLPVRQGMTFEDRKERDATVALRCKNLVENIKTKLASRGAGMPDILIDEYQRSPYKRFQDSQTPLNQILIRQESGIEDMAHLSSVVSNANSFEITRIYLSEDDTNGRTCVERLLRE